MTCRHQAWERRRALAANRSPVDVVHQVVTIEKTVRVERRVEVPIRQAPRRGEWPQVLGDLAAQLDAGRIYDRDLPEVLSALELVIAAYNRRHR